MNLFLKDFIIPLFLFLNYINASVAQEYHVKIKHVPIEVRNAFKVKYPDIKVRQWKKTGNNLYKAEYTKREVIFNAGGKWLETRTAIAIIEIPLEIKNNIEKTEYRSWEIHDATKSETAENPIFFIIEVKKGNDFYGEGKYEALMKIRQLYYGQNGTFIRMVDLTPDSNMW